MVTSLGLKLKYMLAVVFASSLLTGCPLFNSSSSSEKSSSSSARLVMFVGVDISGSFMNSKNFNDSLDFLSQYLYAHLNGEGGLDVPQSLFVGSIGGAKPDEPKTFFPIQTFENKSIKEIRAELKKIFPKNKQNPFTDFNAFFYQISEFVRNKNLVLRPISIVMLSDGKPDFPKKDGTSEYHSIDLAPLETLARKVTLRLLYTDAVTGMNWQTKVKRQRVRVWTQDANVMHSWKDKKILRPNVKFSDQDRFFSWIKDNVDFPVRVRRVN